MIISHSPIIIENHFLYFEDNYSNFSFGAVYRRLSIRNIGLRQCASERSNLISDHIRPPDKCVLQKYFLYFSSKTYVVGAKKNRLNETVLLSTQNTFKLMGKKIIKFYANKISLSGLMSYLMIYLPK